MDVPCRFSLGLHNPAHIDFLDSSLAIQAAQDDLGDAARKARTEWQKTAEHRQVDAHSRARQALAELEHALGDLALARSTLHWLTAESGGLDRQMQAPHPVLGWAADSARVTGNASPLPLAQVLGWVADHVAEPEPPKPQVVQPLQPVPSGVFVAGER